MRIGVLFNTGRAALFDFFYETVSDFGDQEFFVRGRIVGNGFHGSDLDNPLAAS